MRKLHFVVAALGLTAATLSSGCRCAQRACDWVRRPFCAARYESGPVIVGPAAACPATPASVPSPMPMPDPEKKDYKTQNQ